MNTTESVTMRFVTCPSCGTPLFRVSGNCSVDIPCPKCKKTIICDIDDIYVSVFESNVTPMYRTQMN